MGGVHISDKSPSIGQGPGVVKNTLNTPRISISYSSHEFFNTHAVATLGDPVEDLFLYILKTRIIFKRGEQGAHEQVGHILLSCCSGPAVIDFNNDSSNGITLSSFLRAKRFSKYFTHINHFHYSVLLFSPFLRWRK